MGLKVRATVNFPKLAVGQIAIVDPERPNIKRYLQAEYLVPIEPWEQDAEANTPAVPVHGSLLPQGAEDEGTDGDSAQESDVPDGPDAMGEV